MGARMYDFGYRVGMTKLAISALDSALLAGDVVEGAGYARKGFKNDDYPEALVRIAKNPKMGKWQKATSDELDRESRAAKYLGLGLGSGALGAAGIAALSPEARTYAIPAAIALGIPTLAMGAGSAFLAHGKRMYDSNDPKLSDYRRTLNADRYIREHKK